MFIVKLVCDKCGTEASTCDKFCRECGAKGTPEKVLTPDDLEMVRCRSCGEEFGKTTVHKCSGILVVKGPNGLLGEKAWCNDVKGVVKWRG